MSVNDWDGDGVPNYIDRTPGQPPMSGPGGVGADQFGQGAASDKLVNVAQGVPPMTASDAKDWYQAQFVMGTPYANELRNVLSQLGYEKDSQMLAVLNRGVDFAANKFSSTDANGNGDPFELIVNAPIESRGGGGGGGGGPFTNTQVVRNISSADEGMGVADAAYQQQMGRRATMDEGEAFTDALNMMERQNPTKSVQSGVTSGRSTSSTSTTTGGFDAARFAEDWVRSQEGYGENFAATTFMELLDKAISQPDVMRQRMEGIA